MSGNVSLLPLHFSFPLILLSLLSHPLLSLFLIFLPFPLSPLPPPHLPPSPLFSLPFPPLLSLPLPSVVPNDLYSSFSVTNQDTTGATIAVSPISTDLAAPNTAGFLEVQLNEELHWTRAHKNGRLE